MGVIKHEPRKRTKATKTAPDGPSITVDVDMSGVEIELANLAHSIKSYVANSYDANNKMAVFTGPAGSGYHPVLIALEPSDTLDRLIDVSERIATAFERMAAALEKPKAV